jgi:hypothetical protein
MFITATATEPWATVITDALPTKKAATEPFTFTEFVTTAATEPDIGKIPPAREETTVTCPEIEVICVPAWNAATEPAMFHGVVPWNETIEPDTFRFVFVMVAATPARELTTCHGVVPWVATTEPDTF